MPIVEASKLSKELIELNVSIGNCALDIIEKCERSTAEMRLHQQNMLENAISETSKFMHK
jgi:hypothetical protein